MPVIDLFQGTMDSESKWLNKDAVVKYINEEAEKEEEEEERS